MSIKMTVGESGIVVALTETQKRQLVAAQDICEKLAFVLGEESHESIAANELRELIATYCPAAEGKGK